jgi:hypothetical protein
MPSTGHTGAVGCNPADLKDKAGLGKHPSKSLPESCSSAKILLGRPIGLSAEYRARPEVKSVRALNARALEIIASMQGQ